MRSKETPNLEEARYVGNIGMMEMFKFFNVATDKEKAHMKDLLFNKLQKEAWEFMQKVTGMSLE